MRHFPAKTDNDYVYFCHQTVLTCIFAILSAGKRTKIDREPAVRHGNGTAQNKDVPGAMAVHVCVSVCVCGRVSACIYTYLRVCMYMPTYACSMYIHIYNIHTYIHVHVYLYMKKRDIYVYIYIYVYMFIYIYMYVCMYVCMPNRMRIHVPSCFVYQYNGTLIKKDQKLTQKKLKTH
jgi:hypothetical protein